MPTPRPPPDGVRVAGDDRATVEAGGQALHAQSDLRVPDEWTTRYGRHLVASADRSKRTLGLYRRVMDRVAAGVLAPGAIDDGLGAFLQLHGAGYASRLADVSMRFLAGLVETGSSYSYELVERIVPGVAEVPVGAPPAFDPAHWFQRLTDYATQHSAGITSTMRSVMDRVARGELRPVQVEEVSSGFRQERLPESIRQMVGLYFDLLDGLDELNAAFAEQYLGTLLEAADRDAARFVLSLVAPLGQWTSVRLAVANTEAGARALRCVVTEVRRSDGIGPAFEPELTIAPERFVLAAGEEASVVLSLYLAEGAYDPGSLYVATFQVLTPDETLLAIPLRIRATGQTPATER